MTLDALSASWVRAALWWVVLDVVALVLYGGLIALALTRPGAATLVAGVWLAAELSSAAADYVLFPQLYAA